MCYTEREPHEQNESIKQHITKFRCELFRGKANLECIHRVNTVKHSLGTFTDEEAAAQAYDTQAVELFGKFAHKHVFPDVGLFFSADDRDSDEDDTTGENDVDDNVDERLGFRMWCVLPCLRS